MERQTSIHVRVPLALKERVEASARENRRSVVREIQTMLERCVASAPNVERVSPEQS